MPHESHTVIHRDGTFEYRGHRYFVAVGSDAPTRDGSRYIAKVTGDHPGDWEIVADSFGYMAEVRDFIAQAEREGWADLGTLSVTGERA